MCAATLLIVDYKPEFRAFVREAAHASGWAIAEAENGAEMLAYLENSVESPAILLDVVLQDMGGLEAVNRIREINPGAVVLIASEQPSLYATIATQMSNYADLGVIGVLQEPISRDELRVYLDLCRRALIRPPRAEA